MARWTDDHCHLELDPVAGRRAGRGGPGGRRRAAHHRRAATWPSRAGYIDAAGATPAWCGPRPACTPTTPTDGIDGLEALLDEPEVVAVGECGLDYHYDHSPRDVQREVFAAQIALAHAHDLALVIHTREAWADTFAVLARRGRARPRTVFHCFTGGPDEARRCLDLGAVLSFSGIVTFPSRDRRCGTRRRAVPARPAARRDRQPVPGAGARTGASGTSRPACRWSAPAVAAVKGVSPDDVAAADLGHRGRSASDRPPRMTSRVVCVRVTAARNVRATSPAPDRRTRGRPSPARRRTGSRGAAAARRSTRRRLAAVAVMVDGRWLRCPLLVLDNDPPTAAAPTSSDGRVGRRSAATPRRPRRRCRPTRPRWPRPPPTDHGATAHHRRLPTPTDGAPSATADHRAADADAPPRRTTTHGARHRVTPSRPAAHAGTTADAGRRVRPPDAADRARSSRSPASPTAGEHARARSPTTAPTSPGASSTSTTARFAKLRRPPAARASIHGPHRLVAAGCAA